MAAKFVVFVDEDHDELSTIYWLLRHKNHVLLRIQVHVLLLSSLYLNLSCAKDFRNLNSMVTWCIN